MESTNFLPYHPIIQHYQSEKMPELILNSAETPQFIHAHENNGLLLQGFARTVLLYAKIKKEIEYLQELLQDNSIKDKPTLYFDLTKILSHEQSSLDFQSSSINFLTEKTKQCIQTHLDWSERMQRVEQKYQELIISLKEKGEEKENPSQPLSHTSSITEICKIQRDPADSNRINCIHSHFEDILKFYSYQELCCLKSSLKADIAYFNNIENSEEWIKEYSHLSEKTIKQFKFTVDVNKIKDEISLNVLEQIEPIARQQFINKKMLGAKKCLATCPQTTSPGVPQRSFSPKPTPSHQPLEIISLKRILEEFIEKKDAYKIINFIFYNLRSYCLKTHKNNVILIQNNLSISNPTKALVPLLQLIKILIAEKNTELCPERLNLFQDSLLQFIFSKDSPSTINPQEIDTVSNKRKKITWNFSLEKGEGPLKKPSSRDTASPSKNVPAEEVVQKNQTTTAQKGNHSVERVETPIISGENPEKENEHNDWLDPMIDDIDPKTSLFPDIEIPD